MVVEVGGKGGLNRWSTEDFQGRETILYDATMVDTCYHNLLKPIECTSRVNPNVNYGLWVIMMCQCRFIGCNKCTTWCGMLTVGRLRVGGQGVWELSVLAVQFCCEPKTALKIKSILKTKQNICFRYISNRGYGKFVSYLSQLHNHSPSLPLILQHTPSTSKPYQQKCGF